MELDKKYRIGAKMAKKYYAVKNGKDGDGIYESWEMCKAQVHGVKSVIYKGFPTRQEAEAFLRRAEASSREEDAPENPQRRGRGRGLCGRQLFAETKEFACGAVLFWQGERLLFPKGTAIRAWRTCGMWPGRFWAPWR